MVVADKRVEGLDCCVCDVVLWIGDVGEDGECSGREQLAMTMCFWASARVA